MTSVTPFDFAFATCSSLRGVRASNAFIYEQNRLNWLVQQGLFKALAVGHLQVQQSLLLLSFLDHHNAYLIFPGTKEAKVRNPEKGGFLNGHCVSYSH